MQTPPFIISEIHVPNQLKPRADNVVKLKAEVDKHNLTDMWDMILMLDYQVANVHELSSETREEFCCIIALLLKAFTK
ncbi:hypothetical protein [Roseibium polysiphoniae]|uniref:Uncharacterized protein n=1 Tax=Roseibium polysiphoniae TaxID=2571221 RepID=A0A944CC29_9HYPH|nr:hypothetical protein [Roseibium polysiphoniae]MBD8875668.1 hypothetical protein [Roseibium polysiphoniae]MBS8259760.1 hypothetical protein [Roseibium polysiphoniae]